MVIEILSPTTHRRDRVKKMRLYQQVGVKEYCMVDPEAETILVLLLDEYGVYRIHEDYGREDAAKVSVLEDCALDLSKVFPAS